MISFEHDGAELEVGAVGAGIESLRSLLSGRASSAGQRIVGRPDLEAWLDSYGFTKSASRRLSGQARPVRAILFDKSEHSNWSLGWHQDRTIAVQERAECAGFDRWTIKDGIQHVEPPFAVIERMTTARIHLDPVPATNAPLLIIPGSHSFGKLNENAIERLVETDQPYACLADAGDVWWYRTAIVHSSARALNYGHRRVLQIDCSADDLPPPLAWRGVA